MNQNRRLAPVRRQILLVVLSLLPAFAHAHPGQWTPAFDMQPSWTPSPTAVHLMLLRGDGGPYHSRIVWLKGRHPGAWYGGEWGWTPPAAGTCANWPNTSFVKLNLSDPQANIFCAGHVQMGTDRCPTLVVGGTEDGSERGMRFAKILTPGIGSGASNWTTPDSLHHKRWYPTATLLRQGDRAMVATGSRYNHMQIWGGKKNGEAAPSHDLLSRIAVVAGGAWDSDIYPDAGGSPTPSRPETREGHSASTASLLGTDFYFGGRRSNKYMDDAWRLYRVANAVTATQFDFGYQWQTITPPTAQPKPKPRFEHSGVVMRDRDLVIFGGRGSANTTGHEVYGDAWRLWLEHPAPGEELWQWRQITTAGDAPSVRYGHTATWEGANNRMLVFGGVGDTTTSPTDNDVYALTINAATPDEGVWSKPEFVDTVRPPARFDHAMSYQPLVRTDPDMTCCEGRVAYVTGGYTGQTATTKTYADGTIWGLWSYTHGPHAGKLRWRAYTPASGIAPSPRAAHTMEQEAGTLVNLLFGGTNAAGSQDDTLLAIDMSKTPGNNPPTWRAFARHPS